MAWDTATLQRGLYHQPAGAQGELGPHHLEPQDKHVAEAPPGLVPHFPAEGLGPGGAQCWGIQAAQVWQRGAVTPAGILPASKITVSVCVGLDTPQKQGRGVSA